MNDSVHAAPESIVLHSRSQVLELRWAEGHMSHLSAQQLRERCPCSRCEASRIVGIASISATPIAAIEAVGKYGLRIIFADGHDRGIYPWAYLRTLRST